MKTAHSLSVALAFTLSLTGASALNPDLSFYQKAVSIEPSGQFENSFDGQVAVVGQAVHVTYYSSVKVDNWTDAGTNRLWYRRSTDGGQTFEPPTLLAETDRKSTRLNSSH